MWALRSVLPEERFPSLMIQIPYQFSSIFKSLPNFFFSPTCVLLQGAVNFLTTPWLYFPALDLHLNKVPEKIISFSHIIWVSLPFGDVSWGRMWQEVAVCMVGTVHLSFEKQH